MKRHAKEKKMEKYLNVDPASLEEMLAACQDYKERTNIRCALREIKGLKLGGNDIITYSFGSKHVKSLSSDTSTRKDQLPLKPSAINSYWNENKESNGNFDIYGYNGTKPQEERSIKLNSKTDENGNQNPQFKSYLYAGTLSSPKHSPRGKKDSRSPRKVHTAITRIKVLDKSDLVDKCTETEEGVVDTNNEIETESQKIAKLKTGERKERIKRYESTPLPRNQTKENDLAVGLDISAIEFSGDLEKVKQTSVLHRPVSLNLSSLNSDNAKSAVSQISTEISSPRKPRKIVSYRTSAFTAANKLNPVSSTVSRARLQSAPPAIEKTIEQLERSDEEKTKQVNGAALDASKNFSRSDRQNFDIQANTSEKIKGIQGFANQISEKTEEIEVECPEPSAERSVDSQEDIYTAKPVEIKRETEADEKSLVERLRSKLESKRSRDFKSYLQEFSVFTNKMKEKHDRNHNAEGKHIILSPVKTQADVQAREHEVNSEINVISNYTNNKTVAMDEHVDNGLQKKNLGLSRKNRIDLDEHKHYRKYRKKNKDSDKVSEDQSSGVLKNYIMSPSDQKRSFIEMSPRKVVKAGSVRRKLPEIPVKRDSDPEDDETIHQRTIRLLQERRNERREKLFCEKGKEKETVEKVDKSKMSPADLKKTLELKLERSDSKRKANRVRRELQLLNRENELKTISGNKFDEDDDSIIQGDKTDNEISAIFTPKSGLKSKKENESKVVQRSKSDVVRRQRAVSETDVLINAPVDSIDGEDDEKSVLKMFEIEEPLTPLGKIELIGTLMQEEAKLQEMLRKSMNFSEKRKMRAEVRHLRQKRMALEGSGDQQPVSTLRRSASVTAGVVTHATPVYIRAPERVHKKQTAEDVSQSSIEELRKKLSETQDYDEKKKIRLALRQLRQQSREGTDSSLKRSQSFIYQKSSEPVTNGTVQNVQTVLRSQSVTEKRVQDNDTISKSIKEDSCARIENGDISHLEKELQHPALVKVERKPPVPKTVQRHSSFTETRQPETEKGTQHILSTNSAHIIAHLDKTSPKDLKRADNKLKHFESDRYRKKSETVDKTKDLPNGKHNDSRIINRKHSYKEREKFLIHKDKSKSVGDKKPVEALIETVTKLESEKKKRILEKCEIFEKGGRKESGREITSSVKELDERSDKTKPRTPHILVSRADVERNKQNKLVSLRRDRSNSAPLLHLEHSNTGTKEIHTQYLNQNAEKRISSSKNEVRNKLNSENLNGNSKLEVKDNKSKHYETNKYIDVADEIDSRLSPSLLWLEEKRKSLPLSNDIDKLMSTMDIEAAFSEILGAVEEFPEQNDTVEVQTADIPIVEEDSCESSELEEDLKNGSSNEKNGEELQNEPKSNENVNCDIKMNEANERNEYKLENGIESDGDSAIQQTSGNKKSEAKIQLRSNLSMDISSKPDTNGVISVIHGDDGTVTVQEMSRVEEGDTTITEWKKLRRTQSQTEMHETDTVIEKKITSPGGSSSVYEKDVSKTKHKLTSRGSNYFTRNHYNIKRKKELDGTEVVEHDLSSVSENMSVSKNESWGDKSEAKVVLNRDPGDGSPLKLKSIEDVVEDANEQSEQKNGVSSQCKESNSHHLSIVREHLGRPSGSPEVKVSLEELSTIEGDAVILECTVISCPMPTVSWFKGDKSLSDIDVGIMIEFDEETGKARLEIDQASVKDAGEYKCVFENPLGTASTKGRLLIKRKCVGLPSFITELVDLTICEGHSLCLECQVSDTDTVTWYKDGVIQRNNADFKQTFDGAKAKLEIAEIFLDDCGTYSCALNNANGERRCSCKIAVTESESPDVVFPVFLKKPETAIANERDPVIIDCEVIGSPQPIVTWYHDGSKVIEDNRHRMSYDGRVAMLVVRRITVGDSGRIECVAENSSGKVSADCHLVVKALKAAPSVTDSLSDLTVASGKDATLRCVIIGEPKPEISWRKNGLIIGQMFAFKQTYQNGVAVLEISKICEKDSGCYECTATNEKGEISTSCQLSVKDESFTREESVTAETIKPKITVRKETVQTAAVNTFVSSFKLKEDSEEKKIAKSQASKVMLVRQGSLRSGKGEKLDKPLVRTGSLQSIDLSGKNNDLSKSNDFVKPENSGNVKDDNFTEDGYATESHIRNRLLVEIPDVTKGAVDVNKNYAADLNAKITELVKADGDVKIEKSVTESEEKLKAVKAGSELSSLCLESSKVKEVKPVAKFRAGGEIRRSQSVRTPGSEKPEWLQVKLRKVGGKPSPLTLESEKFKLQPQDSSGQKTVVKNETPVSVQREIKLSRSQSARNVDSSLALRDSTNSPSNQPNRDSFKLTSVSERAKIFQMKDSSGSSSGKSSPVEIISKAINLSRAESMRSPAGNRSLGIQRSQSFKMETPSSSQGDVTLELSPQKTQDQDSKSDSASTCKAIKYWDPTAPSSTKMDYSTITDEEQLNEMLSKSENFDERKKIRSRIKEVREQHMRDWEAKSAARKVDYEDPIKRKHREADLMKQQKLKQFEKQAAEHHESKHLDMAEQQLRERVRLADEEKKRTLKEFDERGATHQESLHLEISERALKEKIKQADILKKKTLDAYDQAAGKSDGKTTTTTRKVETVTKVGGATGKPAEEIAPQLAQKILKAAPNVSGVLTVKTESWSSKDNMTRTSEKTESWGGRGGAMNAFKAMDAKNAPKTNLAPGAGRANITRSPSAIKTMLLDWCKAMTREYVDIIEITNFSTSWNNGIAFCALIHHFYPDAFDIKSLDPKQRRKNFELAFDTAEKLADIAPLLDVEDMVRMQKPDWKCVFTYVQSFYRKLNSHERNKAAA